METEQEASETTNKRIWLANIRLPSPRRTPPRELRLLSKGFCVLTPIKPPLLLPPRCLPLPLPGEGSGSRGGDSAPSNCTSAQRGLSPAMNRPPRTSRPNGLAPTLTGRSDCSAACLSPNVLTVPPCLPCFLEKQRQKASEQDFQGKNSGKYSAQFESKN